MALYRRKGKRTKDFDKWFKNAKIPNTYGDVRIYLQFEAMAWRAWKAGRKYLKAEREEV